MATQHNTQFAVLKLHTQQPVADEKEVRQLCLAAVHLYTHAPHLFASRWDVAKLVSSIVRCTLSTPLRPAAGTPSPLLLVTPLLCVGWQVCPLPACHQLASFTEIASVTDTTWSFSAVQRVVEELHGSTDVSTGATVVLSLFNLWHRLLSLHEDLSARTTTGGVAAMHSFFCTAVHLCSPLCGAAQPASTATGGTTLCVFSGHWLSNVLASGLRDSVAVDHVVDYLFTCADGEGTDKGEKRPRTPPSLTSSTSLSHCTVHDDAFPFNKTLWVRLRTRVLLRVQKALRDTGTQMQHAWKEEGTDTILTTLAKAEPPPLCEHFAHPPLSMSSEVWERLFHRATSKSASCHSDDRSEEDVGRALSLIRKAALIEQALAHHTATKVYVRVTCEELAALFLPTAAMALRLDHTVEALQLLEWATGDVAPPKEDADPSELSSPPDVVAWCRRLRAYLSGTERSGSWPTAFSSSASRCTPPLVAQYVETATADQLTVQAALDALVTSSDVMKLRVVVDGALRVHTNWGGDLLRDPLHVVFLFSALARLQHELLNVGDVPLARGYLGTFALCLARCPCPSGLLLLLQSLHRIALAMSSLSALESTHRSQWEAVAQHTAAVVPNDPPRTFQLQRTRWTTCHTGDAFAARTRTFRQLVLPCSSASSSLSFGSSRCRVRSARVRSPSNGVSTMAMTAAVVVVLDVSGACDGDVTVQRYHVKKADEDEEEEEGGNGLEEGYGARSESVVCGTLCGSAAPLRAVCDEVMAIGAANRAQLMQGSIGSGTIPRRHSSVLPEPRPSTETHTPSRRSTILQEDTAPSPEVQIAATSSSFSAVEYDAVTPGDHHHPCCPAQMEEETCADLLRQRKAQWWAQRFALDRRMRDAVVSLEDVLGMWSAFLLPQPAPQLWDDLQVCGLHLVEELRRVVGIEEGGETRRALTASQATQLLNGILYLPVEDTAAVTLSSLSATTTTTSSSSSSSYLNSSANSSGSSTSSRRSAQSGCVAPQHGHDVHTPPPLLHASYSARIALYNPCHRRSSCSRCRGIFERCVAGLHAAVERLLIGTTTSASTWREDSQVSLLHAQLVAHVDAVHAVCATVTERVLELFYAEARHSAEVAGSPAPPPSPSADSTTTGDVKRKEKEKEKKKRPSTHVDLFAIPRAHVYVVLGGALHSLPWEGMEVFRRGSVSRVPSLQYVLDALHRMGSSMGRAPPSQRIHVAMDVQATSKAHRFESMAARAHGAQWSITHVSNTAQSVTVSADRASSSPTKSDCELYDLLYDEKVTMYVYVGHKRGEVLLPRSALYERVPVPLWATATEAQQQRPRSALPSMSTKSDVGESQPALSVLLMGCSSARMVGGPLCDGYGMPYAYLHAGARSFVGALWDVTDGDVDRLTHCLLRMATTVKEEETGAEVEVEEEGHSHKNANERKATRPAVVKGIGAALAHARTVCKLPFLSGVAMVLYGMNHHLHGEGG